MRNLSIPLFLIILLLGTSCSGDHVRRSRIANGDGMYRNVRFDDAPDSRLFAETDKHGITPRQERVVQHSAFLRMEVRETDVVTDSLKYFAERYGGYTVSISDRRSTIRVQREHLELVSERIASMGKLKHRSYKGEDVTAEYVDLHARLDNAKKARDRYLQLLELAEDVPATLAVEKELERVNGEIESMQGRMNKLTHLSDLATIQVDLQEREKLGPLGYIFVGLWRGVSWLFVRS
jgi:hypothetical protein